MINVRKLQNNYFLLKGPTGNLGISTWWVFIIDSTLVHIYPSITLEELGGFPFQLKDSLYCP